MGSSNVDNRCEVHLMVRLEPSNAGNPSGAHLGIKVFVENFLSFTLVKRIMSHFR